jgi:chaperone required for assembly of F1-ATPase
MRRFYKEAAAHAVEGAFTIVLDGKQVRTPGKAALVVPSRALADAVAAEWQAQGAELAPPTLALTRLASTAIDLVAPRRAAIVADIANYAGTDLVCYRAAAPPELADRQHRGWQPLLDWVEMRYGARLAVTAGVMPIAQSEASLGILARAVDAYDGMALAALHLATAACGSLVLALALFEARLDAETAFALSQIDESFEIEHWGEDAEQTRQRVGVREDIVLAARFHALINAA